MIGFLSTGTRAALSDSWALTGVLALWAGMLVLMLGWILLYGQNLPLLEEWSLVPPLTGHEPDLLKWLWQQLNEHRIPVQKAVYLILLKASGGDYRIRMIANAVTLGGLSLALIITARNLRGQTHPADAFFPLVVLNLGYIKFLLLSFAIQFIIYTAILMIWLLRSRARTLGHYHDLVLLFRELC
jgi:hypothetical protein